MTECKRAEFLELMGADTAKLCDLCSIAVAFRADEPNHTCFAMETIASHSASFERVVEASELAPIHRPQRFTFEVLTTYGRYATVSETYMGAMETVQEETGEPVLSVRKCEF